MSEFEFVITETRSGIVTVEADSLEEAKDRVIEDGFEAGIENIREFDVMFEGE